MKSTKMLLLSIALLIALPQGLVAMKGPENKDSEKDPKSQDGWWNYMDTRKTAALTGGVLTFGAATSSTVRDKFRNYVWNPFARKCEAIRKNGLIPELTTKSMLGGAAAIAAGYLGYKWHNMSPEEREKTKNDTYAVVENNKGKLLLGAAAATALAVGYKLATSGDNASKEEQGPQDPKIVPWFKEATESLPVEQKNKLKQTSRIQQALGNPNLFLVTDEGIQETLQSGTRCPLDPEWFIAFLKPEQKKAFLEIVRDYNEENFKAVKQSVAQLFGSEAELVKQIQAVKTPQELVKLMGTREVQPFFNEARKKAYTNIKEISLDYLVIYFTCQEQFASSLGRVSFKIEEVSPQDLSASLEQSQKIYGFACDELVNSLSVKQKEALAQAKISDARGVIMSDPNRLKSNEAFSASLNPQQKELLGQITELYASLLETGSKLYA